MSKMMNGLKKNKMIVILVVLVGGWFFLRNK
jgi:hypothetical protein